MTRKGSDRRITFTQSPFVAQFLDDLSEQTDMSKADLLNTFVQVSAVLFTHREFDPHLLGLRQYDTALPIVLGDVLAALNRDARTE